MIIKTPLVIAIEFKGLSEFNEALQIAKYKFSEVNEDFSYCVLRERGKEALTCIEMNMPFIAYDAKNHEPIFTNVNIELLPDDTKLFVRKESSTYPDKMGFDYLFSQEDEDFLEKWPRFIESNCPFTKRSVTYISHVNFAKMLESDAIALPVFIKTAKKGLSEEHTLHQVIDKDNINLFNKERIKSVFDHEDNDSKVSFLFEGKPYFNEWTGDWDKSYSCTHSLEGDFILSDVMNIEMDDVSDNGKIEYRCFVINNKLANMSRYVDYKHAEVPVDAKAFVKSFVEAYKGCISDVYVVDIAKTDKGYQLVEINPMPNSGRYLNNVPSQIYNLLMNEFANNKLIKVSKETPNIREPDDDNEDRAIFSF